MIALALTVALLGTHAPALSLVASPERVVLARAQPAYVEVRNAGERVITVDATPAAYALDALGRPRLGGTAAPLVRVAPREVSLGPGQAARLRLVSLLPRSASPGDHPAAVVLATRPPPGALPVSVRVGIVVTLVAPGVARREVVVGRPRVAGARLLVPVSNRGGLDAWLTRGLLVLRLKVPHRPARLLLAPSRRLLAHRDGVLVFALPHLHRRVRVVGASAARWLEVAWPVRGLQLAL